MKTRYSPFKGIKGFYIVNNNNNRKYLTFTLNNNIINLEIKNGKYIPKSGLLFKEIIDENFANKMVLDLGCGYLGILSIFSMCYGSKKIDAVDIDEDAVKWLRYLIKTNNFNNIQVFKSNLFQKINQKYDIILSNPPQMPMLNGNFHDSGGVDGKDCIYSIVKESYNYLNKFGKLYMLVFDFLGINEKTTRKESIVEYCYKLGYHKVSEVLSYKKHIKQSSVTYKNLDYIKSLYPKYIFKNDRNGIYFNIKILCIER